MTRKQQIVLTAGGASPWAPADLAALRENTLRLLQQGWRIPVLARHAAAGSVDGGPRLTPVRAVGHPAGISPKGSPKVVGHLVDLVQMPDGSLAQIIELSDPGASARFTSPEIRPQWINPSGTPHGPVIAHIALTNRPLSTGQTPLTVLGDDETFPIPPSPTGATNMTHAIEEDVVTRPASVADPETTPPDENVEQEPPERELPETDTIPQEAATADEDTLLADDQIEDLDVVQRGDEQTSAQDNVAQRSQLAGRIRNSRKLPKGLRDRLAEVVETIQLSSDSNSAPTIPVAEAVEMIEAAIPENVQFGEGPLESPAHPRGEGFFTGGASQLSAADAQRIAKEQLAATGFGATQ